MTDNVRATACTPGHESAASSSRCSPTRKLWQKWARVTNKKVGHWAPVARTAEVTEVIPTSQKRRPYGATTTQKPAADWTQPGFMPRLAGRSGSFGHSGTPGRGGPHRWDTGDIWLRRQVTLPEPNIPTFNSCSS